MLSEQRFDSSLLAIDVYARKIGGYVLTRNCETMVRQLLEAAISRAQQSYPSHSWISSSKIRDFHVRGWKEYSIRNHDGGEVVGDTEGFHIDYAFTLGQDP